eukprot:1179835-Amphidinium_carterae.1
MSLGAAEAIATTGVDDRAALKRSAEAVGVPGQGNSRAAKQRRKYREQVHSGSKSVGQSAHSTQQSQTAQQHPMKSGGQFMTTRDGTQVCFKYARAGTCSSPCEASRAHVCQYCLQPHRNSECTNRSSGKGSGKKATK